MTHILIVDDEPEIRDVYRRLLTDEGYSVSEAADAVEAHEILVKNHIDLVLLDIKMPDIDGVTMHDIIQFVHSQSKVIIASVYPVDHQMELIQEAADFFDKSQGATVLLDKITHALAP